MKKFNPTRVVKDISGRGRKCIFPPNTIRRRLRKASMIKAGIFVLQKNEYEKKQSPILQI